MMNQEVMDSIIRFVRTMLERHLFREIQVVWFGGEPLLGIDIIDSLSKRMIALADQHSVKYDAEIITNGYLMDARAVEVLAKAKVKEAQITLDGLRTAHDRTRHLVNGDGTFETIVDHIRNQKIPFLITIRHNITKEKLQ